MSMLEKAVAIAVEAHKGQVDKSGVPYVLHPLRVMFRMSTDEERAAAVLHDVIEDCGHKGWTLARLRRNRIPKAVVEAVAALTHDSDLTDKQYFEAIRLAAANPIARRVKRADLEDNLDIARLPVITAKDRQRLNKYKQALLVLDETHV